MITVGFLQFYFIRVVICLSVHSLLLSFFIDRSFFSFFLCFRSCIYWRSAGNFEGARSLLASVDFEVNLIGN